MEYIVLTSLSIVFCILLVFLFKPGSNTSPSPFYTVREICPQLSAFTNHYTQIHSEVHNIISQPWIQWPEKNLYPSHKTWTVFPLYAFQTWDIPNCQKLPTITQLLLQLPNLKTALLSRTSPGTKLTPHRGWKNLSNYILRCHFGIRVPREQNSSVHVIKNNKEHVQHHANKSWLIFDDSEMHWSENNSNEDRIILIVDIERPKHIPIGTSDVEDTSELTDLIDNFKKKNILL